MEFNLLALETSSSRCGVALLRVVGDQTTVSFQEHEGSQEHAERLLPMGDALLAQAGLQPLALHAVAFGQGPGGFTGLRVACGVAQGVGLGLAIPVLPVVSHLAVATQVNSLPGEAVLVALDARMNEVYLAVYRRIVPNSATAADWETLQAPVLMAAADVVAWALQQSPRWSLRSPLKVAGDAWNKYAAEMAVPQCWAREVNALRPQVGSVARLAYQAWLRGEAMAAEQVAPLYVRDKVAFTTAERLQGEGGNPKAQPRHEVLPSSRMVVQAFTEADVDEAVALEASVQDFPWTRGNFVDALKAGYGAWVVRQAGQLVGFCMAMFAPDVAHVLVIAVARAWQRQGVGNCLMAWCETQARTRALEGVLLEVRGSNTQAIALYTQRGYRQIGTRQAYYPSNNGQREDAWVMQKRFEFSQEGA